MPRPSGIYIAIETFHASVNGVNATIRKGDLAQEDSPIRKAYSAYFAPVEDRIAFKAADDKPVEQATAAPGERRHR